MSRVAIATRTPCPRLPSTSGSTSAETACHDPTSLQSKAPRTTATLLAFSMTRIIDRDIGHRGEEHGSISIIAEFACVLSASPNAPHRIENVRRMFRVCFENRGGEAEHPGIPEMLAGSDVVGCVGQRRLSR